MTERTAEEIAASLSPEEARRLNIAVAFARLLDGGMIGIIDGAPVATAFGLRVAAALARAEEER